MKLRKVASAGNHVAFAAQPQSSADMMRDRAWEALP